MRIVEVMQRADLFHIFSQDQSYVALLIDFKLQFIRRKLAAEPSVVDRFAKRSSCVLSLPEREFEAS